MIILRGVETSSRVSKQLKDGKYNGYVYIQAVKNPKPGHGIIVRIGETGRAKGGLTTYRPVRGIREHKQADGKQTNMIGKYYDRKDIVTFIFPTKTPYGHKILESQFKQKYFKKYGKSPIFDLDNQIKFLVSNDVWQK
jgi:hypothetical protein